MFGIGGAEIFYFLVLPFLFFAAILGFLIPFFIFKIRNEVVSINKKFTRLMKLLEKDGIPVYRATES